MMTTFDSDDFGVGLFDDDPVDLREPLIEGELEITCLSCGDTFTGQWFDDCPACGCSADGSDF